MSAIKLYFIQFNISITVISLRVRYVFTCAAYPRSFTYHLNSLSLHVTFNWECRVLKGPSAVCCLPILKYLILIHMNGKRFGCLRACAALYTLTSHARRYQSRKPFAYIKRKATIIKTQAFQKADIQFNFIYW